MHATFRFLGGLAHLQRSTLHGVSPSVDTQKTGSSVEIGLPAASLIDVMFDGRRSATTPALVLAICPLIDGGNGPVRIDVA